MAVLHTISQLSFLILLFGAYLTVARPTCKTVTTQMIHVKRLQTTMELTRNLLNQTLSCNQSVVNCVTNSIDFLCNLAVLHLFSNESSLVSSEFYAELVYSIATMLCNTCIYYNDAFFHFCSLQNNLRVYSKTPPLW